MPRRCSECPYCKVVNTVNERKKYYCVNPHLKEVYIKNKSGFIGYGDKQKCDALAVKTHPRWCVADYFEGEK